MRYDQEKEIYRDCRFCGGMGCLACAKEADKAYHKEFPNGPIPIASFRTNDKKDMVRLKETMNQLMEGLTRGAKQKIDKEDMARQLIKNLTGNR